MSVKVHFVKEHHKKQVLEPLERPRVRKLLNINTLREKLSGDFFDNPEVLAFLGVIPSIFIFF